MSTPDRTLPPWVYEHANSGRHIFPDHSDAEIASRVRMLRRNDLMHEPVVTAARDRICRLLVQNEAMLAALHKAREFIVNGADLGFIRMPDASTPDAAHETLPAIKAAIKLATE